MQSSARAWRRFSRNPLSVFGLAMVLAVTGCALFAPWVAPFPRHAGVFVDFARSNLPPNVTNWLGTDTVGRDILSRIIFGFRNSLLLSAVVLALAVPLGTVVGLVAGYTSGWVEAVLMRLTDIFLAIPSLVLAMAILGVLRPSQWFAMMAVATVWWPWYARLIYGMTRSLRLEGYVVAAQVVGTPAWRIVLGQILPNCAPTLLTKASLDVGFVILLGASLSFLGMGAPPPIPDLGTMVSEGAGYLPDLWWLSVMAGLGIFAVVLGCNLVADGLRDLFDIEG
jgi:peptide/nickel transport system permease protein